MAYGQDLTNAARRHLKAAQDLHDTKEAGARPGCKAVAGYLFGLSGELALKEMMRASGMKPLAESERRDDPFFAHFPKIKTQIRDIAQGRNSGRLKRFALDSALFQNWDTNMRYAQTSDIQEVWITAWKASAELLVSEMDLL